METTIPAVAGWNPTRHKDTIKSVGYRLGIWSNEEIDLLKQNVEEFCEENNIKDPSEVIFHCKKDDRKDFYKKIPWYLIPWSRDVLQLPWDLIFRYHGSDSGNWWLYLNSSPYSTSALPSGLVSASAGINRPVQAVYRRLLRMYDKTNNLGRYSEEETQKLKSLKETHGKNWQIISRKLGRSASSVKDKCRNLETVISGKWTPEEESSLTTAVHSLTNTQPGMSVCEGIDWQEIAKLVKSRNELQCRAKWLMHLNWKNFGGRNWTHLDDKQLVSLLAEKDPLNENEIDWAGLAKDWDAVRSAQWLRSKWRMLKYEYRKTKFPGIKAFCEYLLKHPEFLKKRTTKLLDDLDGIPLSSFQTILLTSESDFENIITVSAGDDVTLNLFPENSGFFVQQYDTGSNTSYVTSGDECDSGNVTYLMGNVGYLVSGEGELKKSNSSYVTRNGSYVILETIEKRYDHNSPVENGSNCAGVTANISCYGSKDGDSACGVIVDSNVSEHFVMGDNIYTDGNDSYIEHVTLGEPAVEVVIEADSTDSNDTADIYQYTDTRFNQMVKNDVPLSEIVGMDEDRDVVQFNSPLHCLASTAVDQEILLDDESIFSHCLMNGEDHV